MEDRSLFKNISPLDHRYYIANKKTFDALSAYLSEEANVAYCIKVETALLVAHIRHQQGERSDIIDRIQRSVADISPLEVYEEEEKTQHNIRALVNVLKRHIPQEVRHFVHLGATSVDILDTANALRMKDATRNVVLPLLLDLEEELLRLAERESATPQVGRTHGQHAVPITFGFAIAEFVSRLGKSIQAIERLSRSLCGKLAGAVGAYNSTSMMTSDPESLEREFLSSLGLEASEHSTQLVESEYLLRLLLEMNVAFGIIANLADDLRHLQRSEIAEIREFFGKDQVGSSTMPQKRNPWNSEHVKSLWKAFAPRVMSFFMDQISEHQRDLTNSASGRFVAEYVAGFVAAVERMKRVISSMAVDKERMLRNIGLTGDLVLAEAAYILLSVSGEQNAHEIIRRLTLRCEQEESTLLKALESDPEIFAKIAGTLKRITGMDPEVFFSHPEYYTGRAKEKALSIVRTYRTLVQSLREALPCT